MVSITDTEQIVRQEKLLQYAIKNSEIPNLENFLPDNLIFADDLEILFEEDTKLNNRRSRMLQIMDVSVLNQEFDVTETAARVSIIKQITGIFHDQCFSQQYKYQWVWKWTDNGWQVVRSCCSLLSAGEI
ncbi:nuclear transport factor 2 family protein [Dyadobacter psychrotolerans]|uniref:Nuclear transport factor 2 family protein n=1 Tax=Dyadobacter psychrotolerans TaxID=2541721 RepID=A0A4R5DKW5_9BACT|nr:nuclear transport factor 2 family protein [Dyadobacter psychrotolerans]TDE11273.1 nuclear transport factor 2 family protein [Dyadobacter psychrotolerans]